MIIFLLLFLLTNYIPLQQEEIIIDSQLSFEESIAGVEIPKQILNQLELIEVQYFSFDGKLHQGQLLVNKKAGTDLIEIFEIIKETKFPVAKVIPIVKYDWDDDKSMLDNNSTSFNYRMIKGTKIKSYHSYGLAIDINPLQNPHIRKGKVTPDNAAYNPKEPGTLTKDSKIVREFLKRGWSWGGNWRSSKDYQHFEKRYNEKF